MTLYTRTFNPEPTQRVSSTDLKNEFQSIENGFDAIQVTQPVSDTSTNPATTAFVKAVVADAAGINLPSQPGNSGKFLSTNGTTPAWTSITALGTPIASAATVNLDDATGDLVHITGTTTITAITLASGSERTVVFDGALTLTHNATTLILPGGASITTAAGDRATLRGDGSGNVRCIHYTKASGLAVVSSPSGLVPLSTVVAAGAATVDFTSEFTSAYDNYKLIISGLHGNGSRFFGISALFKKAGAFLVSASYSGNQNVSVSGWTVSTPSGVTSLPLGAETSGAVATPASFEIDVQNVNSTTMQTHLRYSASGSDIGSGRLYMCGSGTHSTTGVLQGLRIQCGGGSMYGTFSLYGIKA